MLTQVPVTDLKIGMFVADLDRPWIETTFLIEGFLIEEARQIAELQRYCQHVMIDRARSTGEEFQAEPAWAPEQKAKPAVDEVTPVIKPDEPANAEPVPVVTTSGQPEPPPDKWSLGGFLKSLRSKAKRPAAVAPEVAPTADHAPKRPSGLAPSIPVVVYNDTRIVEEEVAPAREAYARSSDVMRKLVDDVWAGHPVEIAQVEEVVDEMVESIVRNPDALMWVSRLREQDKSTYGHGLQVAVCLVAFGRHLGFPRAELAALGTIGLLLDIGKIRIPRELLEKEDDLTDEEFETVKSHVTHGLEILSATPNWSADVLEGIAQHHERMDGSGYPRGLKGEEIGIFGRMAAIGDCFAAMTKPRPYANPTSSYEALRSITGADNKQFHGPLAEQFVQAIGVFPVGSLVEISTGEVAVVVSHNKVRRLKPRVLLITNPDKTPSAFPIMVDLLYDPPLGGDSPAFIRRSLPVGAYGLSPRENYLS